MPIPTERPSLDNSIIGKYTSHQKAGGAYDVYSIGTWGEHAPLENSLQSRFWTPPGFKIKMPVGITEFTRPQASMYLQGHTTRAYVGSMPR